MKTKLMAIGSHAVESFATFLVLIMASVFTAAMVVTVWRVCDLLMKVIGHCSLHAGTVLIVLAIISPLVSPAIWRGGKGE